jgi:regulatory protein
VRTSFLEVWSVSHSQDPGTQTPSEDSKQKTTYDRALTLLEFRARSVAELRRKLREKGEPAEDVERVLARLIDQKLLDDVEYARQFARSKLLGAGASRWRIIQELARQGVGREIAERAVETLVDAEGIDPSAAVHRVAEKKWKALAKLDDLTRRRRLYSFLARRGFNPDEIRIALQALHAETVE